jgi:hypothetical protein
MKKNILVIFMLMSCMAFMHSSCKKDNVINHHEGNNGEIPLSDSGIDKKYLAEGFITGDLYRVVIISPKDAGAADLDNIADRAKKRARVSLEQSLTASNIPRDRNTRAEILLLIDANGRLEKKDFETPKYDIYYFDISRKNLKNYLKNVSSQK